MIVPTNTAGVMARRALGRLGGVAAVDMLTLYRLAELIGSPALRRRRPLARVDRGGRPRDPPRAHRGAGVVRAPSPSIRPPSSPCATCIASCASPAPMPWRRSPHRRPRGREAARVSQLTTRRLRADWYDEGDLLEQAELATGQGVPAQLAHTIVFLPQQLRGRELARAAHARTGRGCTRHPRRHRRRGSGCRARHDRSGPRSPAGRRPSGLP